MSPDGAPGASPRIALVLGAGGFRGRASLGVLRRLRAEKIPIDSLIGVSAGALISAYHAGVGWDVEECIAQVSQLESGMLLSFAASRTRLAWLARIGRRRAQAVDEWLDLLEGASFEHPRHGFGKVGILAYDLDARQVVLFATGLDNDGIEMGAAARASAAVPGLLGPVRIQGRARVHRLMDAGTFEALPVARAFAAPFEADRVIAVDIGRDPRMLWRRRRFATGPFAGRVVLLRPRVRLTGTILTRRSATRRLVVAGEESVTPRALASIRSWLDGSRRVPAARAENPRGC